jgi:hypothetical protein
MNNYIRVVVCQICDVKWLNDPLGVLSLPMQYTFVMFYRDFSFSIPPCMVCAVEMIYDVAILMEQS